MRRMRLTIPVVFALSALGLACSGLPGAAPEAELRLDGSPTAGFALDGALTEWTTAPALVIGADQRVRGTIDDGDDLSARIWWALDEDGLVVAGKVRDDHVQLARDVALLPSSDHVAIWISLPAAELPVLGFANQFGEQSVATEAACESLQNQESPDTCKAWFKAQQAHRKQLSRVFVRRYALAQSAPVETWAGRCTPSAEPAPGEVALCASTQAVFVPAEHGYSFEIRVPLDAFPATSQVPLRDVALTLDLTDADEDAPVALASATPKRNEGDGIGFLSFSLPAPIRVESEPAMVEQLLARTPAPGFFYAPGPRLDRAWVFANLAEGYQYEPRRPSPEAVPLAWGEVPQVGALGVLRVYQVPEIGAFCAGCGVDTRLVVLEGDSIRAERALGDATVRAVQTRTPGLQIVTSSAGPMSTLGTGACGACTDHVIAVLGLTQQGTFTELLHDDVLEGTLSTGPDGAEFSYTNVAIQVPSNASWVAFLGQREPVSEGETTDFRRTHRWDEASSSWIKGEDALPTEPAAEATEAQPAVETVETPPDEAAPARTPRSSGNRPPPGTRPPRTEPRRR